MQDIQHMEVTYGASHQQVQKWNTLQMRNASDSKNSNSSI